MISGHMYWHEDSKASVPEIVSLLTSKHRLKNVKHVLVHPLSLDKEISHKGIKIKPDKLVLMHHFWFIEENNSKNQPEFTKIGK